MSDTSLMLNPMAGEPLSSDPIDPTRKRILLVAGDGFTRLVLLFRLRMAGFAVDFTSNGVLGLGKLRHSRPDILLVELRLPGLSGLELIRAARAEITFGDRPVCVYTHANRMNRTTRQEAAKLATKVYDKNSVTREDLVQTLVGTFLKHEVTSRKQAAKPAVGRPSSAPAENDPSGVIAEIVAGVRDQTETVIKETGARSTGGAELLDRVSSLTSCAAEAGLPNLTRQAKALENFLKLLCASKQGCTDAALRTVAQAVEVMSQISIVGAAEDQHLTRFSAVLVDEAPASSRALKDALVAAGFTPVCFADPSRTRDYLTSHKTELIVANIGLPEAHGLGLAEIRQLPLHSETPVVFGPESSIGQPWDEDVPTSSPRLDREPLVLAGVVVQALTEVQNPQPGTPAPSMSSSPSPGTALRSSTKLAPAFGGEDGFNLFARTQGQQEESSLAPSSIQTDFLIQAESTNPGGDAEAETLAQLPATGFEGTHTEEHAVEAPNPPDLPLETEQPPQPETDEVGQVPLGSEPVADNASQDLIMNNPRNQFAQTPWDQRHVSHEVVAATPVEGDFVKEQTRARCAELEQEVATLRQVVEDLNGNFGQPQPSGNEAGQQLEELEERLNLATADLERERAERQRMETDLLEQLAAAKAAHEAHEAARQQAEARSGQLEQDLAGLRQVKDDLAKKLAEKEAATPAEGEEGEQDRQVVAALARATAELAKERGERQRSQRRAAELNQQLQALHENLKGMLQHQTEDQERTRALEEEHRQTVLALERKTGDSEDQRAERELLEAQLEQAKEANAQLRKDLSFFDEANKRVGGGRQELQARLEASLNTARETETRLRQESAERQKLAENLEEAQRQLQNEVRRREALDHELAAAQAALQDREAKVQKEVAERQRLNDALLALQGTAQDRSEQDLALTKLQSNLELEQVERKRQETQLARIRNKAVDAARAARTLRTSLRRQIRGPVDNLAESARRLLELETSEEQKSIAEGLLQDALLVQARLREPEPGQGDAAESAAAPEATET
jgi:CheY-like chemotaxis protein